MNERLKIIICVLIFAPLYLFIYTFFHEGGHAVVALIYGAEIDVFALGLNARVVHNGAEFSAFGDALHHIAGMLLPTVVGFALVALYRSKVKFTGYHLCYFITCMGLIGSMSAWVAIPVISLFAAPPPGDDVTKFLESTGIYPLIVSAGVLFVIAIFAFFMHKKGIFKKIKEIFISLKKGSDENESIH